MMPKAKEAILPGVAVTIGGTDYTAAPLNFGGLRAVMPLMAKVGGGGIEETHAFIEAVLRHALRRNYDGVDQIWLEATLEAAEFEAAALAVTRLMTLSGILKREENATGEEQASRSV
jgi:hypothetical protein